LEVLVQKWEYRRLSYGWDDGRQDLVWMDTKELAVDGDSVDQRLNELGLQGWELISVEKISDLSHVVVSFYLKRPIEENSRPFAVQNQMEEQLYSSKNFPPK
jgi:hypothetical protein